MTTAAEITAATIERDLNDIAEKLEKLAKDVRRSAERNDHSETRNLYTDIAAETQKDILWALANMQFDKLTRDAVRADQAYHEQFIEIAVSELAEGMVTADGNEIESVERDNGVNFEVIVYYTAGFCTSYREPNFPLRIRKDSITA